MFGSRGLLLQWPCQASFRFDYSSIISILLLLLRSGSRLAWWSWPGTDPFVRWTPWHPSANPPPGMGNQELGLQISSCRPDILKRCGSFSLPVPQGRHIQQLGSFPRPRRRARPCPLLDIYKLLSPCREHLAAGCPCWRLQHSLQSAEILQELDNFHF